MAVARPQRLRAGHRRAARLAAGAAPGPRRSGSHSSPVPYHALVLRRDSDGAAARLRPVRASRATWSACTTSSPPSRRAGRAWQRGFARTCSLQARDAGRAPRLPAGRRRQPRRAQRLPPPRLCRRLRLPLPHAPDRSRRLSARRAAARPGPSAFVAARGARSSHCTAAPLAPLPRLSSAAHQDRLPARRRKRRCRRGWCRCTPARRSSRRLERRPRRASGITRMKRSPS